MKKLALNIYFWPIFFLFTVFSLVVLPLLLAINYFADWKPRAQFVRLLIRIHGLAIVKYIPFISPVTIEDRSGGFESPAIFAANHCSSVDPYLFGMLLFENAFMTSWPFKIPIFSKIMKMAEYINTEDGWPSINKQCEKLFDKGCSVIVWPEGHRSRDGKMQRFKKGAFQLAHETKRQVVPVCITGTYKLLPPGKRFFTPSRVKIIILPPITPGYDRTDNEETSLLRDKARAVISDEYDKNISNY